MTHCEKRSEMLIVFFIVPLGKSQWSPQFQQTKSGIALLYKEESNNTYHVCLKLTKEVLTIQKLDVVCTNGSETQVNVSVPELSRFAFQFMLLHVVNAHGVFLPMWYSHLLKHRTVVLRRQANGGLGLSVKVSRWLSNNTEKRERSSRFGRHSHQLTLVSSAFQGGAEHNVPVVISKIFKDQVGKKERAFSVLLWFQCGNSLLIRKCWDCIYKVAIFKPFPSRAGPWSSSRTGFSQIGLNWCLGFIIWLCI